MPSRLRAGTLVPARSHRAATPSRGLRTVVIVVGALSVLLLAAASASAHASFVTSQPEPGSDLAAAPGVVRLQFTEPLIEDLSSVTVTDPLGQTFTGGPTGDQQMQVDVDSTAQGPYTVEWKTVSPIDGHTLTGRYQFGVGSTVGAQDPPSEAPSVADLAVAVTRTVEYIGLLGTLGLLSLSALADGTEVGWRPRGVYRWLATAAAAGTATVTGEVALAASGSMADAARGFLATPTGQLRLARLVLEVIAVTIAVVAVRRGGTGRVEPRTARATIMVLTMGALAAIAWAGHAAASGSAGRWAAAGHLWFAGVWAGTILAMAAHRPPGGWRTDTGRTLAREFAPIALATFTATAVLGIVRGVQELAHVSDLWTTAYGQVLWTKTTMVVVMATLSTLVWRRGRHHPRGEGTTAAAVIALAAILVAFPVPPGRAGDDPTAAAERQTEGLPQPGDLTMARTVADTVVGLSIRPAEPGINDLFVHLVPPGGQGAEDIEVTLTVDDGTVSQTRRCGDACRVATAPLGAGTTLAFQLDGPADATGTTTFTIPELPAPDATNLVAAFRDRMHELDTVRYDEVFGPADPPVTSTWELAFPDRLHGTITAPQYRETIRIGDRWWNRDSPDGPWVEAGGSGSGLSVRADNFLWDVTSTNEHLIGTDTVDGIPTRVVVFFTDLGELPIWYRIWVDDDDRVRRAVMLAQGHFMDDHFYDFGAPITIEPPQ